MEIATLLHNLRNPYGLDKHNRRQVMLEAATQIEQCQDAYANLRNFAESNGLDTATYGDKGETAGQKAPEYDWPRKYYDD